MKRNITDFVLEGKRVIIRVDFNVPIKNGIILDDNRILAALPTIQYAVMNNAKVILMSHLGRVKEPEDLAKNDLVAVSKRLSELLKKKVIFINKTRGAELEDAIMNMKNGDIVLMQNTRYEDLDGKKESSNDKELAKYWASLGDFFINDAFGTAHREHASNVGIASYLPSGVGFLVDKELKAILPVLNNPTKPFTVILGGAKVSDKIGVIENLVKKADYILIGGGMAFTFLSSKGISVGKSLLDLENIDFCKKILSKYSEKVILPVDVVTGLEFDAKTLDTVKDINNISPNEMGLDIGPKTVELFKKYINESKTIIWNGPVGAFELAKYSKGTLELLKALVGDKTVIIGGGDTASAAINMGFKDKFTHISTGGGATLELLEGKKMPGIEVIHEK